MDKFSKLIIGATVDIRRSDGKKNLFLIRHSSDNNIYIHVLIIVVSWKPLILQHLKKMFNSVVKSIFSSEIWRLKQDVNVMCTVFWFSLASIVGRDITVIKITYW